MHRGEGISTLQRILYVTSIAPSGLRLMLSGPHARLGQGMHSS